MTVPSWLTSCAPDWIVSVVATVKLTSLPRVSVPSRTMTFGTETGPFSVTVPAPTFAMTPTPVVLTLTGAVSVHELFSAA